MNHVSYSTVNYRLYVQNNWAVVARNICLQLRPLNFVKTLQECQITFSARGQALDPYYGTFIGILQDSLLGSISSFISYCEHTVVCIKVVVCFSLILKSCHLFFITKSSFGREIQGIKLLTHILCCCQSERMVEEGKKIGWQRMKSYFFHQVERKRECERERKKDREAQWHTL